MIVGDFNERKTGGCIQFLESELGMYHLPKRGNSMWCHSRNSWRLEVGGITLLSLDYDHIVYSPRFLEPIQQHAVVHGASGSDHRLVSAKFRIQSK